MDTFLVSPACKLCPIYNRLGVCAPVWPTIPKEPNEPKFMIVGEAPGFEEIKTGQGFVGKSGQLLRDLLEEADIDVEECIITNAVWCPPKESQDGKIGTPTAEEALHCIRHALGVASDFQPKVIIAVGGTAYAALTGDKRKIKKVAGGVGILNYASIPSMYADFRNWLSCRVDVEDVRWRTQFNPYGADIEAARWQMALGAKILGYRPTFAGIPIVPILHPSYLLRGGGKGSGEYEETLHFLQIARDLVYGRLPEERTYRWITTVDDLKTYVDETLAMYRRQDLEFIGLDIETSEVNPSVGLIPFTPGARVLTVQFSRADNEAVVVMVSHKDSPFNDLASMSMVISLLKRLLAEVPVVAQNAVFDYNALKTMLGITFKLVGDTMLEDHWHNMGKGLKSGLDLLGARYLGIRRHKTAAGEWRDEHPGKTLEDMPLELFLQYSADDALVTRMVHKEVKRQITAEGRWDDYYDLIHGEHGVWQVIVDMIWHGMLVDMDCLAKLKLEYPVKIESCLQELHKNPYIRSFLERRMLIANAEAAEHNGKIVGTRKKEKKLYFSVDEFMADGERYNPSSPQQTLDLWTTVLQVPFQSIPDIIFSDVCPRCGGGAAYSCRCKLMPHISVKPTTEAHNRTQMSLYFANRIKECSDRVEKAFADPIQSLDGTIEKTCDEMFLWGQMKDVIDLTSRFKDLQKLYSTYIRDLADYMPDCPKNDSSVESRVFPLYAPYCEMPKPHTLHPHYHLNGTRTGRISCTEPNATNLPKRKSELASEVKAVYTSKWQGQGGLLVMSDASQAEIRVFVFECEDYDVAAALDSGLDVHKFMASKVHNIPIEEVTKELRTPIKTTTFGILYGQSVKAMAAHLGISTIKAQEIVEAYWKAMPKAKAWIDKQHELARTQKFVTSRLGHRRYLPGIDSDNEAEVAEALREAVNFPIQCCGSVLCLSAFGRCWRYLKEVGVVCTPHSFIHDSIAFDCGPGSFLNVMEAAYFEMAIRPTQLYPWVLARMEVGFDVGVRWGWMVEAAAKFDANRNLDLSHIDFLGKEAYIDAVLQEIKNGGIHFDELERGPHPNAEEAALGNSKVSVHIDRPRPQVIVRDAQLAYEK